LLTRIVGLGNALLPEDSGGPRAVARLRQRPLPRGVDCVEGGTRGLSLLGLLEGVGRVVLVDQVRGFGPPGRVFEVPAARVAGEARAAGGHEAGLPELLRLLPRVLDGPVPEVRVVGIETLRGEPPTDEAVDAAARLALTLAEERDT
jgi:hydrogenase maturation protease